MESSGSVTLRMMGRSSAIHHHAGSDVGQRWSPGKAHGKLELGPKNVEYLLDTGLAERPEALGGS